MTFSAPPEPPSKDAQSKPQQSEKQASEEKSPKPVEFTDFASI